MVIIFILLGFILYQGYIFGGLKEENDKFIMLKKEVTWLVI